MSPQGWLAEGAREAADPKRLTENRERLKSHVKRIQCQKRYDPDGGRPYCEESNAKEGPERMPERPGASRPKRHATPRTPPGGDILAASTAGIRTQATALQQADPGRSLAPMLCWYRGLPITAFPHQSTSRHGQFSPVEASALPAQPQQRRWWSSSAFRVPGCFPNDDQLLLPQLRPLPPGLATRRMSLLLVTVLNDTVAARRLAS